MIVLPLVMLLIATSATTLRFYARKLKKVPFGADDWLVLVVLVRLLLTEMSQTGFCSRICYLIGFRLRIISYELHERGLWRIGRQRGRSQEEECFSLSPHSACTHNPAKPSCCCRHVRSCSFFGPFLTQSRHRPPTVLRTRSTTAATFLSNLCA